MSLPRILFIFSLAILIAMLSGFFIPDSLIPTAGLHPDHASMLQSKGTVASSSRVIILGYIMGLFIIGTMFTLIFLGAKKAGKRTPLHRYLGVGSIVYLLIYSFLTYAYWDYIHLGNQAFFGGFPLPSAWMIYGMWLSPLFLAAIYVWGFDKWVFTANDLSDFKNLVSQQENDATPNS